MDNNTDTLQELLLSREASMSAMALGQGLTHLRKYDFGQTGYFYSSLLQLSTGIERLLKLILIYNNRIHCNKFPSNRELRDFGHNIRELFCKSIDIAKENNNKNITNFYSNDGIYSNIVTIISDFAMQSRYYNLDTLTGRNLKNNIEPLVRWQNEINSIIVERHFRPKKSTIDFFENAINTLENKSIVRHVSEDGTEIDTFREMVSHGLRASTKQKWSMYYVYIIIRYLSKLLQILECKGQFYPYLREFYIIFLIENKNQILQKKTWNPLPPYKF